MSDRKEFLKEAKEVRKEFVKIAGQYSVGEHLELRTEIDTLLIMYDQACERVRVGSKTETSASNCNLDIVSHCACSVDETTGWTQVKCCNICGKPLKDQNWHCG